MKGRQPQTIITDIDTDLKDAVRSELPSTKHVVSLNSILSRTSSWFSLPLGQRFSEFKNEFEDLCRVESTDEFDFRWNHLVNHFGLNSDKHMSLLFTTRVSWALPYTRGCFLARMDSSPYWRSVDIFLKGVLSAQISLCGLFEQVWYPCWKFLEHFTHLFYLPVLLHMHSYLILF